MNQTKSSQMPGVNTECCCSLAYVDRQAKYAKFARIMAEDWAQLLDSGVSQIQVDQEQNISIDAYQGKKRPNSHQDFDILVARPTIKIQYEQNRLSTSTGIDKPNISPDKVKVELRKLLNNYKSSAIEHLNKLPFNGGLVGYITYDFGRELELANNHEETNLDIPLLSFGLYQWAIISNHRNKTTKIYNFGLPKTHWETLCSDILSLISCEDSDKRFELKSKFHSNISPKEYEQAFNKIREYTINGDCYQVNFAQKFSARFLGNSFAAYEKLSHANNAPFSAYLNYGDFQILSLSPERFIECQRKQVRTQPIKGTLPRNLDPEIDNKLASQLKNSKKDRAENLMIVDLLRNDLSKTAEKASVKVTELFGLYQFSSVHHLISTIESKLSDPFDRFDLLLTCLPGGSITGAPKIRAMQIIDELESFRRGIYCGVIGYIDFAGNMDTNICIRTLQAKDNQLTICAGGGLVIDSEVEKEYQESFDKVAKIIPVLEEL